MKSRAFRAFVNSHSPRPPVRRDLFWLCRRHVSKDDAVGVAARRLMENPTPTPGPWMLDLQLVIDVTWETRYGHYTSSLRAQGAALRLADRMKKKEWGAA